MDLAWIDVGRVAAGAAAWYLMPTGPIWRKFAAGMLLVLAFGLSR